jgi:hypothetical protein
VAGPGETGREAEDFTGVISRGTMHPPETANHRGSCFQALARTGRTGRAAEDPAGVI